MSSSPKRIGLIGLSAQGSWASVAHLGHLSKTPRYQITALQNSSKASAQAAADAYSLKDVSTYGNSSDLVADDEVDIVAVAVKVPMHDALLRPAILAGKDVFCEWPLGRNLKEATELVELARDHGVRTMIGLQARQDPAMIKAKGIVASGKIGSVMGVVMYGHGAIFGPEVQENYVYLADIDNGANLLTVPFGHAIDGLCAIVGELKDISAVLANLRPQFNLVDSDGKFLKTLPKTAHDYLSIQARLVEGNGVVTVVYAPESSRTGSSFYCEITGTKGSLLLEGQSGHVQMTGPTLKMALDGQEMSQVEVNQSDGPGYNVGKAWDAWAGQGLEDGHSVTTFENALVRHQMIDAIYRAAESGTRENYL